MELFPVVFFIFMIFFLPTLALAIILFLGWYWIYSWRRVSIARETSKRRIANEIIGEVENFRTDSQGRVILP